MDRLVFILVVTFGSAFLGYVTRRARFAPLSAVSRRAGEVSRLVKIAALFVLNPVPIVNSFWRLSLGSGTLIVYPLLGLLSVSVAGLSAVALNSWFSIPPKRAASVFIAGMFTNIISLGGLTAFAFFGHDGYALVPLFNTFISVAYYAVGFPVSHKLSLDGTSGLTVSPRAFRERPYLLVPPAAMALGLLLNVGGVAHPVLLDGVSGVLIPLVSGMISYSIGLTLYFGRIGAYRKEIVLVALIKFMIVPAVMIPLGILAGLPHLPGGLPFRVLVILSVMPVAFNALVPPAIYGFDLDLANSAWVVTTLALIPILPLLYFFVGV